MTAGPRVVLVMGPGCAGKSTYVLEHSGSDDAVIDFDWIAQSMFGSPDSHDHTEHVRAQTVQEWSRLLDLVRRGELDAPTIWITSANPRATELFPYHELVVLDPGEAVALERAEAEGRPPEWATFIAEWYGQPKQRTPNESSRQW